MTECNSDSAHEQGSGFARGAAGSLLAKPSGRAVNSKSIREYEAELNPLPDYAADPGLWRKRMEHNAHAFLKRKGVVNDQDRSRMVNAALNAAATTKPGDERTAWRSVFRERRALIRRQKAYEAQKTFEKTVERWLVSECMLPSDIVKLLIKQSDIKNTDRSKLARLVDVTMMSIEQQFNVRRQYAVHFAANALDERVVKLWQRVHEVGERDGWTLQERVSKLNNALGGVAHIYMYPHTPEQALAAFEERFGDGEKPIEPPEVKAMAGNKFATFMGSFSNLCEFHGVPEGDAVRDAIRHLISKKLYGVESFKDLPEAADTIRMTKELKAYLDEHYPVGKPAVGIGDASAEPPVDLHQEFPRDENNKPVEKPAIENGAQKAANAPTGTGTPKSANESASTPPGASNGYSMPATALPAITPIVVYAKGPCAVYPMHTGSINYKGVKFSVTFYSPDASWDMAVALMEQFVAHKDLIDPSCLVGSLQNATTGGSVPPRDDMPPMDDDEPSAPAGSKKIETEMGTRIARSSDGGKTKYTIWYNAGAAETKFPLSISNPQGVKMLDATLKAERFNVDKWDSGKSYPVAVRASWTQGAEFAAGKHYRDWVSFEVIKEAVAIP